MDLMNSRKNRIMNALSILIAVFFLFPLYWIIINSFKTDGEIFTNPPTFWPRQFTLDAYRAQFNSLELTFKNSMIISLGSLCISLLLSVPAAYGLAKIKVKGIKLFLLVFLITQMLPASLVLTPLYLTFSKMHLLNNYLAPILATATISIPFNILMLRPSFLRIPNELVESARIDGCTVLSAFIRIVIPISKPTIVTAACFSFVFAWNDLAYSMTFNVKESLRPMTAAIYTFMNQYGTKWNMIMAYGVLLIMPSVIIFVTMQKHIVEGMTNGSVKG